MSQGTNPERIEQNNQLLEQNNLRIKAILNDVEDLPEYQSINPVFAYSDMASFTLPRDNMSSAVTIESVLSDYVIYKDSNSVRYLSKFTGTSYSICVYKLIPEVTATLYIIAATPEHVFMGTSQGYVYDYNISLGSVTKTATTVPKTYSHPKYDSCFIAYKSVGDTIYYFDTDTITFTKYADITFYNRYLSWNTNVSESSGGYNKIVYFDYATKSFSTKTYSAPEGESFGIVRGIGYNREYIFLNNGIYNLNADFSLGGKITNYDFTQILATPETTSEWSHAAYNFYCIGVDWFFSPYNNKIYKFDRTNYTFEEKLTLSSATIYPDILVSGNNIYRVGGDVSEVGFEYKGRVWYYDTTGAAISEDILEGRIVYDQNGIRISGIMPNNGELNFTPTEEVQTIPAGYTTGGKIEAIDYANTITPEEYSEALDLAINILGEE